MKTSKLYVFILLSLLSVSTSCRSIRQGKVLSKCEFRLESLQDISLANVRIDKVKSLTDLNLLDAGRITLAFARNSSLPMDLTANIEVKNPNKKTAGLNELRWILYIDDVKMAEGESKQRFEVPAQGTNILPLKVNLDLKKAMRGKSRSALLKFAFNMAGFGSSASRVKIRAKPSFKVLGGTIRYPGYIKITKEYTSE
ncbi:LEA type 2 family protein [uncultured Microscilla sp.]|uniref:LEA type 2 family protein n=1 Tax=uncultured Microscilla sp. TaxID=432653 RepID=UPI002622D109|nr:LEA type 2 family protein [uncultured Microscilla sp.]